MKTSSVLMFYLILCPCENVLSYRHRQDKAQKFREKYGMGRSMEMDHIAYMVGNTSNGTVMEDAEDVRTSKKTKVSVSKDGEGPPPSHQQVVEHHMALMNEIRSLSITLYLNVDKAHNNVILSLAKNINATASEGNPEAASAEALAWCNGNNWMLPNDNFKFAQFTPTPAMGAIYGPHIRVAGGGGEKSPLTPKELAKFEKIAAGSPDGYRFFLVPKVRFLIGKKKNDGWIGPVIVAWHLPEYSRVALKVKELRKAALKGSRGEDWEIEGNHDFIMSKCVITSIGYAHCADQSGAGAADPACEPGVDDALREDLKCWPDLGKKGGFPKPLNNLQEAVCKEHEVGIEVEDQP